MSSSELIHLTSSSISCWNSIGRKVYKWWSVTEGWRPAGWQLDLHFSENDVMHSFFSHIENGCGEKTNCLLFVLLLYMNCVSQLFAKPWSKSLTFGKSAFYLTWMFRGLIPWNQRRLESFFFFQTGASEVDKDETRSEWLTPDPHVIFLTRREERGERREEDDDSVPQANQAGVGQKKETNSCIHASKKKKEKDNSFVPHPSFPTSPHLLSFSLTRSLLGAAWPGSAWTPSAA